MYLSQFSVEIATEFSLLLCNKIFIKSLFVSLHTIHFPALSVHILQNA